MMFKGDWGCFPNKQICEDCTEGKIEKMSEPVPVYTACQFVYRLKTSPEAVSTAIIQSISSPKAEPFKRWLAQVGRERIEETIDPEQAIDRALETYQKRDMIQTGFISGFFLFVSIMSLPLNGRSEAYSRAKNI